MSLAEINFKRWVDKNLNCVVTLILVWEIMSLITAFYIHKLPGNRLQKINRQGTRTSMVSHKAPLHVNMSEGEREHTIKTGS